MATEKPKHPIYLKLGSEASLFSDPANGVKIANQEVIMIDRSFLEVSKKLQLALSNGHIKEATAEEFDTWKETSTKDKSQALETERQRLANRNTLLSATGTGLQATLEDFAEPLQPVQQVPDKPNPSSAGQQGGTGGGEHNTNEKGTLSQQGLMPSDEDLDNMNKTELIEVMKNQGFSEAEIESARTKKASKIMEVIKKGPSTED